MAPSSPAYPGRLHAEARQLLNQVEIWFGILARSALRHRSFVSVAALAKAIRFGKYWNDVTRRPFDWTYTGRVLRA